MDSNGEAGSSTLNGNSNDRLSRLLQEYGDKLDKMRTETEHIHGNALDATEEHLTFLRQKLGSDHRAFQRLQPKLIKLAQRVSQGLEHTAIDDLMRIELEVRLADFEANIHRTSEVFLFPFRKRR